MEQEKITIEWLRTEVMFYIGANQGGCGETLVLWNSWIDERFPSGEASEKEILEYKKELIGF